MFSRTTMPDVDSPDGEPSASTRPGVVLIFAGQPLCRTFELGSATSLIIGREGSDIEVPDERVSRQHAKVTWKGEGWEVRDLDSRNGTFVDAVRIEGASKSSTEALVRVGHALCLLVGDVVPFKRDGIMLEGEQVLGPALQEAQRTLADIARRGDSVLICGETGVGKELAARWYHNALDQKGSPFVAVNCAAIPEGLAERVLFGAKKGAYSGATADADGHAQAADGGTLFLDEIGELDPSVQAKLLRLLESGEALPVGAAAPEKVSVRLCGATHRNLRKDAADGRFREDLYHRIGRPEVRLPPLSARQAEIPFLIASTVETVSSELDVHAHLIESCCLRPWPGNVRELVREIRHAASQAVNAEAAEVRLEFLDAMAGQPLDHSPDESSERPQPNPKDITAESIEAALQQNQGNVAAAARQLGVHRVQLYRLFKRFGIEPRG